MDHSEKLNELSVFYTNADSILNKLNEIKMQLEENDFDILIFTETLPKNRSGMSLDKQEFQITGYNLFMYEIERYQGRGVAIYVKETINASFSPNSYHGKTECIEVLIRLKGNDWLLVQCVYRSPSTHHDAIPELDEILSSKRIQGHNITHRLIVGDFNFKDINWNLCSSPLSDQHPTTKFLEIVKDNFLYQHVKQVTRVRQGCCPSILDLVFTNEENMVNSIEYCSPLGNSDHVVLTFKVTLYIEHIRNPLPKFQYHKGNYECMNCNIKEIDWYQITENLSALESWDVFADKLFNEIRNNIPVCRTPQNKHRTPWIDHESLKAIRKKKQDWNKYIHIPSENNLVRYKISRNETCEKIRKAKRKYEEKVAENIKDNPKAFWRYVQSNTKTKEKIGVLYDQDGNVCTEDQEKAQLLNNYFCSVFTDENQSQLPVLHQPLNTPIISTMETTPDSVKKLLNNLNVTKSAGPDDLHPKVLKELADSIATPLSIIFNKSIEDEKCIPIWKTANICALFKKGTKSNPGNYRPISLTSVISKILEKEIRKEILDHMESNNLFTCHQHGFRSNRSCTTQLLEAIDYWTKHLDQGENVDIIYFDFRKAFDTVPHTRLLTKLQYYGIQGHILGWIKDFLRGREQRVVLNGYKSEWSEVRSGIPQGSVLGPILFLIYINDLPDVVNNIIKLFADDTKIYSVMDNPRSPESIQQDINKMVNWSEIWQLQFNVEKCKVLQLGGATEDRIYTMLENKNRIQLERTKKEKDLGVIIDQELNWKDHIYTQINKANRMLGLIRRSFCSINKEIFLQLYKSLVRPHLEYASQVWYVVYKKEAVAIENVQRRATKLVKSIENLDYTSRLRILGLPSLEYRRLRADMIETFKILNNIDVVNKEELFIMDVDQRTRGHNMKIKKQHCRRNPRKLSFANRIISPWNNLPQSVVSSPSVNSFKHNLNNHWKEHPCKFEPFCYVPGAGVDINFVEMGLD